MKVLVLNSGSSTQKSALFELGAESSTDPVATLWEGKLEWQGDQESLHIRNSSKKEIRRKRKAGTRKASVEAMLENLWSGPAAVLQKPDEVVAVGHRIVHGGPKLTQPAVITPQVKQAIADVAAIAPLHNEAGLQGIELIEKLLPGVRQVAVFDTGFHRTLPHHATVYPVPYEWYERGIRRFGFHGINHEYCAHRAARILGRDLSSLKIITCHLGNGCSLAAIDGGKSVDTTMGFTPLEGLMMGTRSGSVDPGILIHVMRGNPRDVRIDSLDDALNHRSGLLGISGVSSDMRDILEAMRTGNQRAQLSFDMFVHRLRHGIGAMAASLGQVDVLIFTAGIGENSPEVREATCASLGFLGVALEASKNSSARPDTEISSPASRIRVLVIAAHEDWAIAGACVRLCGESAKRVNSIGSGNTVI
jgi:acetate kinase